MAAILSLSGNLIKTLSSPFLSPLLFPSPTTKPSLRPSFRPIFSSLNPSPIIPSSSGRAPAQQPYQPFRPPPSPLPPKFRSLDTAGRLNVLANRLGLWFEYAPLIPSLIQEGFTPPTIEEATGISGVEQNRLVVAAQVRETLIQSGTDPEIVASFETGGAELLYEIRLLSTAQRSAAATYIVRSKFDAKDAQDLARAMKDFPRRRGEKGWDRFEYALPGDCLAFLYYRQSREHRNPSEQRTAALEQALEAAVTEKAKAAVLEELQGDSAGGGEKAGKVESEGVKVPVVRMKTGEVGEASSVVVLPVCRAEQREKDVVEAPSERKVKGEFGVVEAEKGWSRWVVLPGWVPIVELGKGGVVVAFPDARVLPWKANRWYREEAILVVVDRSRKVVEANDSFYLVVGDSDLKVERGSRLREGRVEESLGMVVLVVRPPKDDIEDQLIDEEDWE